MIRRMWRKLRQQDRVEKLEAARDSYRQQAFRLTNGAAEKSRRIEELELLIERSYREGFADADQGYTRPEDIDKCWELFRSILVDDEGVEL